jgi:hypothetical protein
MLTKKEFLNMKKDIKSGYFELIEKDFDGFNLLILNEDSQIRISLVDYENQVQGQTVLDIWELYDMNTERFEHFLNEFYYYCDEPLES